MLTYFEVKEDALILKKVASALLATAFASSVFPLPGGPNNNNPINIITLKCLKANI